ncbi:hypothetical protein VTN77DRAFT_4538 [Rasamsonia byssochlamydoides]|uniref:uncharacterized protein n=1 Tax=Rasamsonia byssochlamydoides TaxID=89139 RepID=UPI0037425FEF
MFESSCLCGANRISFTAEPVAKLRCHCLDCRKWTGSTFSNNLLVPLSGFKILQGTLKTYTKEVESGHRITNNFCGNCGSTLYRMTTALADGDGMAAVMIGCVDGMQMMEEAKPEKEVFVRNRPKWMAPVEGAEQVDGIWRP